jgi:signal transduction histidine kinase
VHITETAAHGLPSAVDHRTRELIDAVQRLSLAQTLGEVQEIVRTSARRLCGADGATFVLRDGDRCYYADEDAISPLWKGQRFPLESCISGWAMRERRPAVIEDIYVDARIPHDAYRPTFVQSLAMVPIRRAQPIGAIGNYWQRSHLATPEEVELLQALADATAVAMINVGLWSDLETRVAERTAGLNEALKLNERLIGTLAHELRNTVGASRGLLELALSRGEATFDPEVYEELALARRGVADALQIVDEQLDLAKQRAGQLAPRPSDVQVADLLADLAATYRVLRRNEAVALVVEHVAPEVALRTDAHLLTQILRNLVSNALKFTDVGEVRLAAHAGPADDEVTLVVSDTGVGIAAADQGRIFEEFAQVDAMQHGRPAGTGLGLPFVRRVLTQLGGRLELESEPGRGSTFRLMLPSALGPSR